MISWQGSALSNNKFRNTAFECFAWCLWIEMLVPAWVRNQNFLQSVSRWSIAVKRVNKTNGSMWTFVLSIFTPGRRYSNVFTWSFRRIFAFSTHALPKPAWIFFPTDSASPQLMLSFSVAVKPDDKILSELLESKGLCLLNQAYIFLRSSLSRFLLVTPISTWCSLLLCYKPVKLHIPLWISAQRCMLHTHVWLIR